MCYDINAEVRKMKIYESSEDYLERILIIKQKKGNVHSIDIANELNFSKPSVSVAMKKLRENGYIIFDKDGSISLTEKGNEIATKTYEKHIILTKALMALGVPQKDAEADACKIEHDLSEASFNAIKSHVDKNF